VGNYRDAREECDWLSFSFLFFFVSDVDPKPSDSIQSLYDLVANIPHDSTAASTSSAGKGPGVTKKSDPKDEGETSWKVGVRQ
jgi:hypothetical protein